MISQNPQVVAQQVAERQKVVETGEFQGQKLSDEQITQLRSETEQLRALGELAKKPNEFKQKVEEIKAQLQTQLNERQKQAASQAQGEALKQGLRIGLTSLMLCIAYSVVGWFGLRLVMLQN